jgi:hypothetical protein
MSLQFIELGFTASAEATSGTLPDYLGATLRGAFGFHLKQTVCQVFHGRCTQCLLQSACPYPALFDGVPPRDRQFMRLYPAVPQPFVLLVPEPGQRWGGDDELRWGVRLFGGACRFWPYVLHSFETAGAAGIGRARVHYQIESVSDGLQGAVIWRRGGDVAAEPVVRILEPRPVPPRCRLRWRFLTPLSCRRNGQSERELDGISLLISGRRRFEIMSHFYGAPAGPAEQRPPRAEPQDFKILHQDIRPWGFERFSNRQQRRMRLDGLLGEIIVEGPWGCSGSWLHAIETLHLGKATSFGFGRVEWEPV